MPENDRELIRRILAGDVAAVQEFDSRYRPRFELIARSLGARYPDDQDVAQEGIIDALRQLPNFRWQCSLGTWLERILRGKLVDSRRKLPPASVPVEAASETEKGEHRMQLIHVPVINPNQEAVLLVRQVLDAMPPRYRALLKLNLWGGLTGEQIGARLGWPKGTAGRNLTKAKEVFRSILMTGEKFSQNPRLKKGGRE